jgi:AAA+ ATPase superfamily predicted ATPase
VVYGRRRTGKTELIEQSFINRNLVKFEGLENKNTTIQKQHFLDQLSKYVGDPLISRYQHENWRDVFEILSKYVKNGEVTLYFEEIQWMASYEEDLIIDLKYAWDNFFRKNSKLILVLCGSAPSFVVNKIIKSKSLHNRTLHRIHLKEFSIQETKEFIGRKNIGNQELMDTYLTVGGIPEYLKYIKKESSSYLAICKESFVSGGFFTDEYERIFTSSLSKNEHYLKIIEYLAKRKFATRDEILNFLKLKSGGSISLVLQDLEDCGFIEQISPLGSKDTTTLCLYSIKDAYLQFYFKFIKPLNSKIEEGQFKEFPMLALSMETYRKWLGFSFERWCRRINHQIAKKIGFSAIQYESGSYFKRKNKNNQDESFQIDLLYKRADRVLTICEVKYTSAPVGVSVIKEVEKKLELLADKKRLSIHKVLISANGVDKSLQNKAYFDQIFTLEDLLMID